MDTARELAVYDTRSASNHRTVALMMSGLEREFEDFRSLVMHYGGTFHEALSVVEFSVGPDGAFRSLTSLCDSLLRQWGREAGRLRCCWIDRSKSLGMQLNELVTARPLMDWVDESVTPLNDILKNRGIETWFQPIFSDAGLALWGYECLARARDAQNGLISPDILFGWARKENQMLTLDRICREKHIERSAAADVPKSVQFLINFLPTVVYDSSVSLGNMLDVSRRAALDPERVVFEVVETERVHDRAYLCNILGEYRKSGFGVALDDVGAGHSSLTLLADLSPDLIKIDRALVSCAVDSEIHASVCRSIIEIGHASGKLVLAEGVETAEEYGLFHAMGVDLYQGFLFGKPHPEPAARSLFSPPGNSRH